MGITRATKSTASRRATTPTEPRRRTPERALGAALVLAGLGAAAVALVEAGASRRLRDAETVLREAIAGHEAGRLAVASAALDRAADARPGDPEAWLLAGESLSGPIEPRTGAIAFLAACWMNSTVALLAATSS